MTSSEKNPAVSFILPVYNGAETLVESIRSLLNQSFTDFELLIFNDGSRDQSWKLMQEFASDSRVRLFNQENRGLAATLNRGLAEARGEWIARQDQDDVSFPNRLQRQMDHVRAEPGIVLLGTWAEIWLPSGRTPRVLKHPLNDGELRLFLYFDNPFVHSSMIFRREAALKVGGYSTAKERQPEDYDFWCRLSEEGKIGNLPEYLLAYREWPQSMSRVSSDPFPYLSDIAGSYANQRLHVGAEKGKLWGRFARQKSGGAGFLSALLMGLQILLREKTWSREFLRRWLGGLRHRVGPV